MDVIPMTFQDLNHFSLHTNTHIHKGGAGLDDHYQFKVR